MGTWGTDIFQNDDAGDWAFDLAQGGMPYIRSTLDEANVPKSEYLDAYSASGALAACDVIARMRGHVGQSDLHTEEIDAWVAARSDRPSAQLVEKAIQVIDRVLAGKSELAELWTESDEEDAWRDHVEALRDRLTAEAIPR